MWQVLTRPPTQQSATSRELAEATVMRSVLTATLSCVTPAQRPGGLPHTTPTGHALAQ
jgi:hypothetical protein